MEWGNRQAAKSPRWTDAKWQQVSIIFGVVLAPAEKAPNDDHQDADQDESQARDAA